MSPDGPQEQSTSSSCLLLQKQKRIPRTKDVEEQDTARATLCRRQDSTLGKMKSRLQGGRFRMLNETLYTAEGQEAFSLMQARHHVQILCLCTAMTWRSV